jgi:hypothetical protein
MVLVIEIPVIALSEIRGSIIQRLGLFRRVQLKEEDTLHWAYFKMFFGELLGAIVALAAHALGRHLGRRETLEAGLRSGCCGAGGLAPTTGGGAGRASGFVRENVWREPEWPAASLGMASQFS